MAKGLAGLVEKHLVPAVDAQPTNVMANVINNNALKIRIFSILKCSFIVCT